MQIADWLIKLELGQYARCFTENEIDFSVLRHSTLVRITLAKRLDEGTE